MAAVARGQKRPGSLRHGHSSLAHRGRHALMRDVPAPRSPRSAARRAATRRPLPPGKASASSFRRSSPGFAPSGMKDVSCLRQQRLGFFAPTLARKPFAVLELGDRQVEDQAVLAKDRGGRLESLLDVLRTACSPDAGTESGGLTAHQRRSLPSRDRSGRGAGRFSRAGRARARTRAPGPWPGLNPRPRRILAGRAPRAHPRPMQAQPRIRPPARSTTALRTAYPQRSCRSAEASNSTA